MPRDPDRTRPLSIFGEALAELLRPSGLSHSDLARALGMQSQALSRAVTDGGSISRARVEAIGEALSLSDEDRYYLELAWVRSKHRDSVGGPMAELLDRAMEQASTARGAKSQPLVSAWFRVRELATRLGL